MTEMSDDDYRQVLSELETLLQDTAETLQRFVETGMDQELPEDYQKLLRIQAEALHEQQVYLDALRHEPDRLH